MAILSHEAFDYAALTQKDREDIHYALAETTEKHILASPGWFSRIDFDTARNPSQILETKHLSPAPSSVQEVEFLADAAGQDFFSYVKERDTGQGWFFNTVRGLMNDGHNIFPVTNHGNIADIAFEQAGWVMNIGQDDWQDRNGLTISRGVTTVQAFEMAASEVVQKMGHVFLSFPRTQTIRDLAERFKTQAQAEGKQPLDIDLLIDTNNREMRKAVKTWLGIDHVSLKRFRKHEGGRTYHQAWSGSTDKVLFGDDHRPESITLGSVATGVLDIVKHGLVVPTVVWYGDEPLIEYGEVTKVDNEADVRSIQQWQADRLAGHLGLSASAVKIEKAA